MTATATMIRGERAPARTIEQVLAHVHLRLGSLALAQAELETMAGLGLLDTAGFVDLAEVRWRSGDLSGAGEAAAAAMRAETADPTVLVIAAEAASALGRPTEARRLAGQAMSALASTGGSIDVVFAGMPRSSVWPGDGDEPPPTAPTLFDGGPEAPQAVDRGGSAGEAPSPTAATAPRPPTGPVALGFWDEGDAADRDPADLPDPARELEAGRAALVSGSFDQAAIRFGIALRLAPALAAAILEATSGARGSALAIVRGDAYRLLGDESSARAAYATAAQGGALERRKRSRGKAAKGTSKSKASASRRRGADRAGTGPDTPGETDVLGETDAPGDTVVPGETDVPGDTRAAADADAAGGTDAGGDTEVAGAADVAGDTEATRDTEAAGTADVASDTEATRDTPALSVVTEAASDTDAALETAAAGSDDASAGDLADGLESGNASEAAATGDGAEGEVAAS